VDKKKLSQLRPLKKELELIDRKLDRLYERQENVPVVMGKVTGSSKDFPYVEVRTSVLMDEPKEADEIEKQIRIREKRREQVEKLITEIEQFIAEIPDSRDRQIFELIYIDGKKQREVADEIGLERSVVSKRITNYLNLHTNHKNSVV
jgi:RNA polymerase sigma factor (sigma-70 family)